MEVKELVQLSPRSTNCRSYLGFVTLMLLSAPISESDTASLLLVQAHHSEQTPAHVSYKVIKCKEGSPLVINFLAFMLYFPHRSSRRPIRSSAF